MLCGTWARRWASWPRQQTLDLEAVSNGLPVVDFQVRTSVVLQTFGISEADTCDCQVSAELHTQLEATRAINPKP